MSTFFDVNLYILVHINLVHWLYKFFSRFTFFQSSHILREPLNLGSHITHAPKLKTLKK